MSTLSRSRAGRVEQTTSAQTRIIFVASLMVQLRGIAALNLIDLAAASKIDVATILEVFRTKDDLIAELQRRGTLQPIENLTQKPTSARAA